MGGIVARLGVLSFETRRRGRPALDAFGTLLRGLVAQQISVKAAASIHDRVLALFEGRPPTPADLLAIEPQLLRSAGLSGRKVEYALDLAERVASGALDLDGLAELDDEQVIEQIVAVRGFGTWSGQIFCMFGLERPDVLPTGDLGIRRAVQIEYGLPELPVHDQMVAIAEPWRPQRTLACIYLWETLHVAPVPVASG